MDTSTYSKQINIILRDRLIPKMQDLTMEVAKIEPYSYSNTKLEDNKRQLDYLSMLYDFLYEYAEGNEELDNGKLVNVVRLIDPPTRERKSLEMLSKSRNATKRAVTKYTLLLDKLEFSANDSFITPGTDVTFTVIYTNSLQISGEKSIAVTIGGVVQTSNGFTMVIQNKNIPLILGGTTLTLTAQAMEDEVAIGAAQTFSIPIANVIDSTFYYGVGAPSANAATIQAMTKVLGPRESKTFTFSPVGQVYYFAYPVSYGALTSIKDDNNLNITEDFTITTKTFDLELPNFGGGTSPYFVYEFENITSQPTFDITFNF